MNGKSFAIWVGTKFWCMQNPNKNAMIVTPEGSFVITFHPKNSEQIKLDINWIEKFFLE